MGSPVLDALAAPIIQAPMAGGPSTPRLTAAVGDAGGLGLLAAGYKTVDAMRDDIAATRALSSAPFGVGVFAPVPGPADPATVAAYAERIGPDAAAAGVALGEPRFDDDAFDAKIAALADDPVAAVSFAFGCPGREVVGTLRAAGIETWVTVTTPEEAREAVAAGADALVVQGIEAGGHRGGWHGGTGGDLSLLVALQLIAAATDVPLIATGGLMTGAAIAWALAAGASAVQLGTAFLLCPEAGTSAPHRAAVTTSAPTAITRAFSGRPARGIVNRFLAEHSADAPAAYPEVHHLTTPLRAHGRANGDADVINLWAGEAHPLATAEPAGDLVRRLHAAITQASHREAVQE